MNVYNNLVSIRVDLYIDQLTFAILKLPVPIRHILRINHRILPPPNKLLRANLLVAIILRRPPKRERPSDQPLPRADLDGFHLVVVVRGYVVDPAFAGAEAA